FFFSAEALISYVGESTVRLDSELKKIATSLGAGGVAKKEDIRSLVSRTAEVKPWEFSDALAARDVLECERILSHMKGQSSFGLLALSLSRIRDLIATKALERRGDIGSLASVLGRPDWQVRNYRHWASRYSSVELRMALISGADTEKAMKSGADADLVFERWILSILDRGAK
ncbi:MAG: DNA polymerase III subunit delta, partial [Actinobacteria bacterium]|nr:DNA polymerase III subunit delta [Actinomycetota bacterium]